MTAPLTLAERRAAAEIELAQQKELRALASMAGDAYDHSIIQNLQHEIDALIDAERAAERQERAEHIAKVTAQLKGLQTEIASVEASYLAAVARAECASRDLVAAYQDCLSASNRVREVAQLMGVPVPITFSQRAVEVRLSERLSAVLTQITMKPSYLGSIALHAGMHEPTDDWVAKEKNIAEAHLYHMKGTENDGRNEAQG